MTDDDGQRPTPQEIVVVHRQESPGHSPWDSIERITKLLSLIAIPVVVAVMGSVIQSSLGSRGLDRDYVQLAVSILTEPESDPTLKRWAGQLLADRAPTPLPPELLSSLTEGNLVLPRSYAHPDLRQLQELQARQLEGPIRTNMRIARFYKLVSTPADQQHLELVESVTYTMIPVRPESTFELPIYASMMPLPGVPNEQLFKVEDVRINGEVEPTLPVTITQTSSPIVRFEVTYDLATAGRPVQVAVRTRRYVPLADDWTLSFSSPTRNVSLVIQYPESLHTPRLFVFPSGSRDVPRVAEMTPGRVRWDIEGWFMRGEGWVLVWR